MEQREQLEPQELPGTHDEFWDALYKQLEEEYT